MPYAGPSLKNAALTPAGSATELAQQIGAVEVGSIVAWKMSMQSEWKVDRVELGVDDASFATHAILSTRRRWSLRGTSQIESQTAYFGVAVL